MKELLEYILKNILEGKSFEVEESEEDRTILKVKASKDDIGLIIGKGGNTVKAIQTLLRVRGRIDNKLVNLTVSE